MRADVEGDAPRSRPVSRQDMAASMGMAMGRVASGARVDDPLGVSAGAGAGPGAEGEDDQAEWARQEQQVSGVLGACGAGVADAGGRR